MGRNQVAPLTRERIAATALQLFDEDGAPAVTVRNIAARLGVRSPSLYNHVRSKDEILDAVTELIGTGVDLRPLQDQDWKRGLAQFARSYRAAFREHPAVLPEIARRAVETDSSLGLYDAALVALQRAGWTPATSLRILAAVDFLVLGSALETFTRGFVRPVDGYRAAYPALAASLEAVDREELDEAGFELGLALLLDGLERLPR